MKKNNLILFILLIFIILSSCKTDKEALINIAFEARTKYLEGDPKAAINIFEKNFKKADRRYGYYFYHGYFVWALGEDPREYATLALESFMQAYRFEPNSYEINDIIGTVLFTIDKFEQAIPYFERAYELYLPESEAPSPHWYLTEAYLHAGRLDDALKINTEAIEEFGFSYYFLQRGIILSYYDDFQVLSDNISYVKKEETNNIIDYDDLQALIDDFDKLIGKDTTIEIEVPLNTGVKLLQLKALIDGFLKAKEMETSRITLAEIHRDFTFRLIQMDYTEQAYQLLEIWLVGSEATANWCYMGIGYILMLNGAWEESLKMLDKAKSIRNNDEIMMYISFYYFFSGDFIKAFEYEALARSYLTHIKNIPRKKTINEFIEEYKNNWEFQMLLQKHYSILHSSKS